MNPAGLRVLIAATEIFPLAKTGGLADTIVDATPEHLAAGLATGFFFDQPSAAAMLECIDRAVALYRQPQHWQRLQQAAMRQNFSWTQSARAYLQVYQRAPGLIKPRPDAEPLRSGRPGLPPAPRYRAG